MPIRLLILSFLITLFVLPATAQDDVVVPDLTGLSLAQATAILNANGLHLGEDTAATMSDGLPNTIVSQSIAADTPVPYGTAIDVEVFHAPNVRLIYDDNDITFINLTSEPMTVDTLIFTALNDTTVTYHVNQITGEVAGDECLQIWSITRGEAKPVEGCEAIQWRTTSNPDNHFWTQTNGVSAFALIEDNIQRGECPAAPANSQDTPLTCDVYVAGGASTSATMTPYIYLAYTRDAIAFINNTPDRWMLTDLTTILNNNPALDATGVPLIFGDTDLLREEFRVGLGDITTLAPKQCIMFTLEGADVSAPPEDCQVIAQRALSPDVAFWTHAFGIQSQSDTRDRSCPAALTSRLTLCILPR